METIKRAVCDAVSWALRVIAIVSLTTCATAAATLALFIARLLSMLGPLDDWR